MADSQSLQFLGWRQTRHWPMTLSRPLPLWMVNVTGAVTAEAPLH